MPELTTQNPAGALAPAAPDYHPRTLKIASADSLPFDLEAEKSVLSAIFLDPTNFTTVSSILGSVASSEKKKKYAKDVVPSMGNPFFRRVASTMFHEPMHAAIYEAMLNLSEGKLAIDVLSVSDWLSRAGRLEMIGGLEALVEIQTYIVSAAHLESWCHLLRDYAMLREMMKTCSMSLELCKQGHENIKELLDSVESEIFQVRNKFVQSEIVELRALLKSTFNDLMEIAQHKVAPGIPTEFPDLDRLIGGGLKPGEMFVLAARPSIGKTALALNIVRNIINRETDGPASRKKVAFFSLEMTDRQIIQRLLCTEAKVPLSAIYEGSLQDVDTQRLAAAVDSLRRANLYIDSTSAISVFELRAKARKLKELNGIDLIVIDYLQLMRAGDRSAESRQVEVAAISGGLKAIAKELNVPVLVLAQLSRESEKSTNPKENPLPKLSHLRESGAIEQDADLVVFLHRNRDESKEDNAEGQKDGIKSMLIVEKNRNGRTGIVNMRFIPQLMEFRCIEHKYGNEDVPVKKD